jgi:CheY-like chemotaxis protein
MNSVLGMTELVLETDLNDGQRQFLTRVYGAGEQLLGMIDHLLDISKIEASTDEFEDVEFSPVAIVERVLWSLGPIAESKWLRLDLDVGSSVPERVVGDEARFRQVLTNLVQNAIKYTPAGKVSVNIESSSPRNDVVGLSLSITDTGPGVAEQDRLRIFDDFERVRVQETSHIPGVGLGLAIARRWVDFTASRFGFETDLRVEAAPGVGSVFSFTWYVTMAEGKPGSAVPSHVVVVGETDACGRLAAAFEDRNVEVEQRPLSELAESISGNDSPVVIDLETWQFEATLSSLAKATPRGPVVLLLPPSSLATDAELPPAIKRVQRPASPSSIFAAFTDEAAPVACLAPELAESTDPLRVLVVDDDEPSRLVVTETLRRRSYQVTDARSGAEALTLSASSSFDLVILDLRMSGMDGFETAAALRRLAGARAMPPILGMTAHASPAVRARAIEEGFADLLSKPLRLDGLMRVVSRYRKVSSSHGSEFDGAALMGHLEGNLELLSKLVDTFGRTSRVDLERLSRAIAAADCDEIRDVCHKLSGCVREFTSSGPIEHLDRLRTLARSDRYEAVALRDAQRALGAAIEKLKEDLVRLLGEQLGS